MIYSLSFEQKADGRAAIRLFHYFIVHVVWITGISPLEICPPPPRRFFRGNCKRFFSHVFRVVVLHCEE